MGLADIAPFWPDISEITESKNHSGGSRPQEFYSPTPAQSWINCAVNPDGVIQWNLKTSMVIYISKASRYKQVNQTQHLQLATFFGDIIKYSFICMHGALLVLG